MSACCQKMADTGAAPWALGAVCVTGPGQFDRNLLNVRWGGGKMLGGLKAASDGTVLWQVSPGPGLSITSVVRRHYYPVFVVSVMQESFFKSFFLYYFCRSLQYRISVSVSNKPDCSTIKARFVIMSGWWLTRHLNSRVTKCTWTTWYWQRDVDTFFGLWKYGLLLSKP